MRYNVECRFRDFPAWGENAKATQRRIVDEGKEDEAEDYFAELMPSGGWTDTAINDILAYDPHSLFIHCGMKPDNIEEFDTDEISEKWQEENNRLNFKFVRIEWGDKIVVVVYTDLDNPEDGEQTEDLDEDDISNLIGCDHAEIDDGNRKVYGWNDEE